MHTESPLATAFARLVDLERESLEQTESMLARVRAMLATIETVDLTDLP